jgi:uncharacterized protein YqeY
MDILEALNKGVKIRTVDGVDIWYHENYPIDDLIEEAAEEISILRKHLKKIIGEKDIADILWSDLPDTELVTVSIRLKEYRDMSKYLKSSR